MYWIDISNILKFHVYINKSGWSPQKFLLNRSTPVIVLSKYVIHTQTQITYFLQVGSRQTVGPVEDKTAEGRIIDFETTTRNTFSSII